MQNFESGYVAVNGLKLYYEIHGSGEPLIMVHGGVVGSFMFGPILPIIAAHRQVITVDLQAHGRTLDSERPLRYEWMADDIAALIAHLGLQQVDVLGYSLGSQVVLRLAIQHPDLIRRLILVSPHFKRAGSYPEVIAAFDSMDGSVGKYVAQSPLAQVYPDVNWEKLFIKMGEMLRIDFDWSEDVASLKMPVMLVYADADSIRTTHIMEFYALLGGGQRDAGQDGAGRPVTQLAIIPNQTHYSLVESPVLASTVLRYLDPAFVQ